MGEEVEEGGCDYGGGDKQFGSYVQDAVVCASQGAGDIVMGFDVTNAFGTLCRSVTESEMAGAVGVLRGLWQRLYGSHTHMW